MSSTVHIALGRARESGMTGGVRGGVTLQPRVLSPPMPGGARASAAGGIEAKGPGA
jgi:hypothetical protein